MRRLAANDHELVASDAVARLPPFQRAPDAEREGGERLVPGVVSLLVVDGLQSVHIERDDRRNILGISRYVGVVRLSVEKPGQGVLFGQLQDRENVVDEQSDRDRHAEELRIVGFEQEGEEQPRQKDHAEEDDRNDLRRRLIALTKEGQDQPRAVEPRDDEGKKPERTAIEIAVFQHAEHDAVPDRRDVEPRQNDRGNKDEPPLLFHQSEEDLRDDEGRRAVADRHQYRPQRPIRRVPDDVELGEHDDRQKKDRDIQDQNTPHGPLVEKDGRFQRDRERR